MPGSLLPIVNYNSKGFVSRLRLRPYNRYHISLITGKAIEKKKRYPETPALLKNQTTVSFLTKMLVSATCNGLLYTEPGMALPNPSVDQLFIPPIR
jgi:hypothetical protein